MISLNDQKFFFPQKTIKLSVYLHLMMMMMMLMKIMIIRLIMIIMHTYRLTYIHTYTRPLLKDERGNYY